MSPHGSVAAHIRTGRSPMAQDHFKTSPDPQRATHIENDLKIIPEIRSVYGTRNYGDARYVMLCNT